MRTLKSLNQNLLATIDGKAVFMSNLQGEIYKQFPVECFKNSDFTKEVEFPGDFLKEKEAFNVRIREKQAAKAAAREALLKQREEAAHREYERRRQNVLLLRKLRNDVEREGEGTVYCVRLDFYLETSDDSKLRECEFLLFSTEEEARRQFDLNKSTLSAECGQSIEMNLLKSDFEKEVLQLTSYDDFLEEYKRCHLYDDETIDNYEFVYAYRDISADIVIQWSWEKYVGYSRNLIEIDYGIRYGRTECDLITGNEECTFRPNYDIVMTAEELEGMSREEVRDELTARLSDSHYRWNRFGTGYETMIDRFIDKNF